MFTAVLTAALLSTALPTPEAVLEDAIVRLAEVGLKIEAVDLELSPAASGGFILRWHGPFDQVRVLQLERLAPTLDAAGEQVARGVLLLTRAYTILGSSETIRVPPPVRSSGTGRVAGELATGLLGVLAGGSGFGLIGASLGLGSGPTGVNDGLLIGSSIGTLLGAAGGVSLGGHLIANRGDFGWALLGASAGALLGSPLLLYGEVLRNQGENATTVQLAGMATCGLLGLLGSVLFLEEFGNPVYVREEALVLPSLVPHADGGLVLGIGGRF